MIRSFKDKRTAAVFKKDRVSGLPPEIVARAARKLDMLNRARTLADLRCLPGNRLEVLRGTREGQHSIRVNDQWRICFQWREGDVYDAELVDYH